MTFDPKFDESALGKGSTPGSRSFSTSLALSVKMSNPEVSEVSHKGEEEEESKECQETMEEPKEGGGGQQLESVGEENSPEPEPKPKPAAKSAADVRKERMERLRTLHLRRVRIGHYVRAGLFIFVSFSIARMKLGS